MILNTDIKVSELTSQSYDREFKITEEYERSLPDIQNEEYHSNTPIEWVGMAGIRRPLLLQSKNIKEVREVDAYIVGQVDCQSHHRGINMSRLNRELANFDTEVFNINVLKTILDKYRHKLQRSTALLTINFNWRDYQPALRTPDSGGHQYYNITFDVLYDSEGQFRRFITVDYIYSSHCPCSTDLSEHAAYSRGVKASPHAQRSIARIKMELSPEQDILWIEDIVEACRRAVPSQVQIFVKRVDEQAFAELCAAEGTVFVEDAIRLFEKEISSLPGVKDYKILCLHAESLHPWAAHACIVKPGSKFENRVTIEEIRDLNKVCGN